MTLLEFLKAIKPEINAPNFRGINILSGGIKLFDIQITKTEKGDVVQYNPRGNTKANNKKLAELLPSQPSGTLILEENPSDKLGRIEAATGSTSAEEISYFHGKIPDKDIPVLEAAQYVKAVSDSGMNVDDLKSDIFSKYGVRGNNITRLYTTDYFSSLIKLAYEELSKQEGFTLSVFRELYEVIVNSYPFAVFVSKMDSLGTVKMEILRKMKLNLENESNFLNIHAIGRSNVSRLNRCLADKEVSGKFIKDPDIDQRGKFVTVTIYFH